MTVSQLFEEIRFALENAEPPLPPEAPAVFFDGAETRELAEPTIARHRTGDQLWLLLKDEHTFLVALRKILRLDPYWGEGAHPRDPAEVWQGLVEEAREIARQALYGTPTKHPYTSTACSHGLHEQCRLVCKFCESPCICDCHQPKEAR